MTTTEVIAVAMQKGGSAKTTTAVAVWALLNAAGRPTLLVDADPQCSASLAAGFDVTQPYISTYDLLRVELGTVPRPDPRPGPWDAEATPYGDLLPSHINLARFNTDLAHAFQRETVFRRMLAAFQRDGAGYAYILVDCPPSLDWLTINVLTAADRVLIPVVPDFLSAQGLPALAETLDLVRHTTNPALAVAGVVLTRVSKPPRSEHNRTRGDVEGLCRALGWPVAPVEIRDSVKAAEAARQGVPVPLYHEANGAAADYRALAAWLFQEEGIGA